MILLLFFAWYASFSYSLTFDAAMGKNHILYNNYYEQILHNPCAQKMLFQLQELYVNNSLEKIKPAIQPKIPKIIHQIWLGSSFPEKYKKWQKTWQKFHPEWHYILWTDREIENLKLENIEAYNKAINYGERSDIARYEILYRLGGLYIDTDFECLKSFDILHHCYDFYTGLELPAMAFADHPVIIPNGLIGSKPHHPILRACIDAVKSNRGKPTHEHDVVGKTGPLVFSDIVLEFAGKSSNIDIVFPALFFYPIDKKTTKQELINQCINPETFAIHHWAGSWILKEEAFVPGIKVRCRQEGNILKFAIIDERKKSV